MMQNHRSQSQCKKTTAIWRLEKQLAKVRAELDAAIKLLEDTEAERDGLAEQADCAMGHVQALFNLCAPLVADPMNPPNAVADAAYYLSKQVDLEA